MAEHTEKEKKILDKLLVEVEVTIDSRSFRVDEKAEIVASLVGSYVTLRDGNKKSGCGCK